MRHTVSSVEGLFLSSSSFIGFPVASTLIDISIDLVKLAPVLVIAQTEISWL